MGEAALELQKYRDEKANILCPTTKIDGLSEWHDAVIDSVRLSIKPDDGDVYKQQSNSKNFIITGQGLQKLAICAGVVWNPRETRATSLDRDYVAYNAVGCIRKTDGQMVCFQAEYDIDMRVVEDDIRQNYEKKEQYYLDPDQTRSDWFRKMDKVSQKSYIVGKINEELNFKRRHKTKLAATGAKNRVIRALLGIKKNYTAEELAKPFVMPRVIIRPDYSDPAVKRTMMQAAIQSMTGVYGPMPSQLEDDTIDLPDTDFCAVPDDEPGLDPDPHTGTGDAAGPETTKDPRLDFESADKDTQVATLEELARRKGFPINIITKEQKEKGVPGILYALDQFSLKNRMNLFDQLVAMPDLPTDDDIPY